MTREKTSRKSRTFPGEVSSSSNESSFSASKFSSSSKYEAAVMPLNEHQVTVAKKLFSE